MKSVWIPVSDRLPDVEEDDRGDVRCVAVLRARPLDCCCPEEVSNVAYLREHPDEYSHWFSLPDLPSERSSVRKKMMTNRLQRYDTIFSGENSRDLWDSIAAMDKKKKTWEAVYALGCLCQQFESIFTRLEQRVAELEKYGIRIQDTCEAEE